MSIGPKYSMRNTSFQEICKPKSLKTRVTGSPPLRSSGVKNFPRVVLLSDKALPLASPRVNRILLTSNFFLAVQKLANVDYLLRVELSLMIVFIKSSTVLSPLRFSLNSHKVFPLRSTTLIADILSLIFNYKNNPVIRLKV